MNGNTSPASLSAPWYNSLLEGIDRLLGRPTAPGYDPQVQLSPGQPVFVSPGSVNPQRPATGYFSDNPLVITKLEPVEPFWYHEEGLLKGASVTPAPSPVNWQDHYRQQPLDTQSGSRRTGQSGDVGQEQLYQSGAGTSAYEQSVGNAPGLIEYPTLDFDAAGQYKGTTVEMDGRIYVLPAAPDWSLEDIMQRFRKTGEHWGIFSNEPDAQFFMQNHLP
jgi:hypothetical protein